MSKKLNCLFAFFLIFIYSQAQNLLTPDKVYGQLFVDVQMNRVFSDSKTFADCLPKKNPEEILRLYNLEKNNPSQWFCDYILSDNKQSAELTLAGMAPLFLKVADANKILPVKATLQNKFLKPGRLVTTSKQSGQQWDAPNAWAPLQWISIIGLKNYTQHTLSKNIANRWVFE